MATYDVVETIKGAWAKGENLKGIKKATILNEVKPSKSRFKDKDGNEKMQDVGKVKFEGVAEPLNLSFNKATLNGLVRAFGKDSKNWVNKPLSVETEKVRVAGKSNIAIYLIPEGFEKVDDENGYAMIVRQGGENNTVEVNEEEIPIIEDEDIEEQLNQVPF